MTTAYRLGEWTIRPQHACIERGDEVVHLKPKPVAVLECLRQARGEVVTRDELFERVWPGGVISDATLTQCIVELRRAFGDSAQNPQFIKTIPKVGFCLVPPIEELVEEAGVPEDRESPGKQGVSKRIGVFGAALVIAMLAFGSWWYQRDVVVSAPDSIVQDSDITPSIAVLPFVNMSDEPGNEYFADGLTEELQILLARIPQLKVSARTSSFAFRNKDVTIAEIAKTLNVAHLLEGSVRKSDERIRISVQLIEAQSGFELWSESYERTLDDIFAVQDDVAKAVVDALRISLMNEPPRLRETDAEAYSLYLQGNYLLNLAGKENTQKAMEAFQQALAIDPEYAPAWSSLHFSYAKLLQYGVLSRDEGVELAMGALDKALEIDDKLASAWAGIAYMKRSWFWDWEGARVASEKALRLEPNNASVISTAASIASTFGQLDKAIELFERNVELDPMRLSGLRPLANRYREIGRFDEALAAYNKVLVLNPEYLSIHLDIATTYLRMDRPERALTEMIGLPDSGRLRRLRSTALFDLGRFAEAQAILDELLESPSWQSPFRTAAMYAWRGENDDAFEWLEVALEIRQPSLSSILWYGAFARLSDDPRYPVFLEKMGLREAWEAMPPEYGGPSKH